MLARLAPLLAPGLDVVFVGTEPGAESLRLGQYYADPSNSFYADLHRARLTSHRLAPAEFGTLICFGIGLDDVYDESAELQTRLEDAAPMAVCFNSKRL